MGGILSSSSFVKDPERESFFAVVFVIFCKEKIGGLKFSSPNFVASFQIPFLVFYDSPVRSPIQNPFFYDYN